VRFRVSTNAGVPESKAHDQAAADIEAYRKRIGYRTAIMVEHGWHLPGYFDYVVRFEP